MYREFKGIPFAPFEQPSGFTLNVGAPTFFTSVIAALWKKSKQPSASQGNFLPICFFPRRG
ncbi:MAG TPA: hypothetical protein VKB48_08490 [Candidatus Acidoferrum sp.]|nr:hypothetical protein [Candidatus Acidoferrum sp.]